MADVSMALPMALRALGHDVRVFLPRYRCIQPRRYGLRRATPTFAVPSGRHASHVYIQETVFPNTDIPVYCIEHRPSFDRAGIYQRPGGAEYPDNLERFSLLCRATLAGAKILAWQPDIIHAHDWQTSLLATYLRTLYRHDPYWQQTAVTLSIHNLAYQGIFPMSWARRTGLTRQQVQRHLGLHTRMSLLVGGLRDSHQLVAVSPTYAREIQTPAYGCGLHRLLQRRRHVLRGIVNGMDECIWNPATDPLIPARYTATHLRGKARCKRMLQRTCRLPQQARTPVLGVVTRFVAQKGLELIAEMLPTLCQTADVQCVILGAGERCYARQLSAVARRFPDHVHVTYAFDNRRAHLIEAGSDMFLMPSLYEPCGLNQMYSQRYGTVPIVRHTGGLADTVVPATPTTLRRGTATGVMFRSPTPTALLRAVHRTLALYGQPQAWRRIVRQGMRQNFSWQRSARAYVQVYRAAQQQLARRER
jgi:starch synthase